MPRIPWRKVVLLAVLGTTVTTGLVVTDVVSHGGRNPLAVIQPGQDGPSIEVFRADFPEAPIPDRVGHDGQQFYAMARSPFDLDHHRDHLDRPRYRLQRPALPLLGWALHPSGGGIGLVRALVVVNLLALVLGGVAAGGLAATWGGPIWIAAVVPILPGAFVSLRLTVADALAVAFVLAALLADARGRPRLAVGLAVATVLAKESLFLVLVGWLLARRSRSSLAMAGIAGGVAATWWTALRLLVDVSEPSVVEFTLPFVGLAESAERWVAGHDLRAAATVALSFGLALVVALRRRRHPLLPAVVLSAALLVVLNINVIGLDFNATRTAHPTLALAVIALATPRATATPVAPPEPAAPPGVASAVDRP